MAAAVALIWANSPIAHSYTTFGDFEIGPDVWHLRLSVGDWARDGLLAIFFFVAGLELKRELVIGELSTRKQAILPVAAAVGGVVVPAVICLAIGWGQPDIDRAWAIPVATDIAFALGVLALVGSRVPSGARVFLLALAVVDDLIAIVLIAVLFTATIDLGAAALAVLGLVGYWLAQHYRITSPLLYVPLAVGIWIAVLNSGFHATLAGVALGLLTRVRADPDEDEAPATRLEHRIQPFSATVCVPLFALLASGVSIDAHSMRQLVHSPIAVGVIAGLLLGKPIGIFGTAWCAVRFQWAARPKGLHTRDMFAVSLLGGIGFTVSLLIADLALPEDGADLAKTAVLVSSMIASLIGAAALVRRGRVHRRLLEHD